MQAYSIPSDLKSMGLLECPPEHLSVRPNRDEIPPRSGHVSACVNMTLFVWGGYQDENTFDDRYLPARDFWSYNVDYDKWSRHVTRGSCPPGTSGACCCVVDDCFYLVFGHTEIGNTNKVYRLDLRTMTWSKMPASELEPSPRDKFALWTYNKDIYCFGGFGVPLDGFLRASGDFVVDASGVYWNFPARGWNNQLLVLDTKTGIWSNPHCKGSVPLPRAAHGVARLNDTVFLFGGRHLAARMNDLHSLDLSTLTWSGPLNQSSAVPCGRSWHTFTPVSSNLIFLYGGYTQDQKPLSDAWVLDVNTVQWSELNVPQNNPRLWHTTCVSSQDDILVFGGCSDDILSQQVNEHCNKILVFRLQPKSLLRLCFETVFNYHIETKPSWSFLPLVLQSWLKKRLQYSQNQQIVQARDHCDKRQTSTCDVS